MVGRGVSCRSSGRVHLLVSPACSGVLGPCPGLGGVETQLGAWPTCRAKLQSLWSLDAARVPTGSNRVLAGRKRVPRGLEPGGEECRRALSGLASFQACSCQEEGGKRDEQGGTRWGVSRPSGGWGPDEGAPSHSRGGRIRHKPGFYHDIPP